MSVITPKAYLSTGEKARSHYIELEHQSFDLPQDFKLNAAMHISYQLVTSLNLFSIDNTKLAEYFPDTLKKKRALIIIDEKVDEIYGDIIKLYFKKYKIDIKYLKITSGEKNKNLDQVISLIESMDDFNLSRRSEPLIAIGGGVLLDIAGLASNLYRRGVSCIKIPTTLMGLIDAAIGVKTGVNLSNKKNKVGTYFSPSIVYLDRSFLKTLSDRHLSNGVAEIIKLALVKDKRLFELLETNRENILKSKFQGKNKEYDEIINRSIYGMLEELASNLWEDKLERLVDYGHSFGPMIEMHSLPKLLHGESVSIDMSLSTLLSENRGLISKKTKGRILSLISSFNLPLKHHSCTVKFLMEALKDVESHRDGKQRLPLTSGIGEIKFVNDLSEKELKKAVSQLQNQ